MKTLLTITLVAFTSLVVDFLHTYIWQDAQFIVTMMILLGVDTVFGFWLAVKRKNVSADGFGKLFGKIAVYGLVLVATHSAATFKVHGETNTLLGWLDTVLYAAIVIRELLAIFEKTSALGIFTPPKFLLARLKMYDDTGEMIIPEPKAKGAQP